MDLKSKRIVGISQILLFAAMLVLYTRIGGMGMICVAGSMEVFLFVMSLFFGGLPDAMEAMAAGRRKKGQLNTQACVQKAGIIYGIVAAFLSEGVLLLINRIWIENSGLTYVDKMLELFMFVIPFVAVMQVLHGILQVGLDKTVIGISKLIFSVFTIIGMFVSYLILNEYGTKVAALMQSIRKWHFYVVIGLVPGILCGTIASILFLMIILWMRHDQIDLFSGRGNQNRERISVLCVTMAVEQCSKGAVMWLKHIVLLVLLGFSFSEIAEENYLFGHFYGAVLPLFCGIGALLDTGLTNYKKRLYAAYKKHLTNIYYRDLKAVLSYALLHGMLICALTLALHKSYLAIWSLQTSDAFMTLMTASAVIGFLYFPCIVITEVLKYRNLLGQRTISAAAGTVAAVLTAFICSKTAGAGTWMYVLSVGVGLLVVCIVASVYLSMMFGINYISVLLRISTGMVATAVIGVIVYFMQQAMFTALGGFVTLLICAIVGWALQFAAVLVLRIFSKEELQYFPLPFLTTRI